MAPLTEDQITAFTDAFHCFDTDGKGTLSRVEVMKAFGSVGETFTKDEMNKIMRYMDTNEDKAISLEEYLVVMAKSDDEIEEDSILLEAFDYFDKNLDGRITMEELKETLKEAYGVHLDEKVDEDAKRIMREYDGNRDNKLSFEEFKRMVIINNV